MNRIFKLVPSQVRGIAQFLRPAQACKRPALEDAEAAAESAGTPQPRGAAPRPKVARGAEGASARGPAASGPAGVVDVSADSPPRPPAAGKAGIKRFFPVLAKEDTGA